MSTSADVRREIRTIIWVLLFFGAAMSMAGNVVHAFMLHGWSVQLIGPVVAAMIAPVALLGLMHLMGAWSRWPESDGVSYWVFLAGVVILGAAAFRLSFAALRDLAMSYGYGRFDASLFPLILDGLMALMTWGLVAATRPKVAHQATDEATPQPATASVPDAADTAPAVGHHRPYELPIQYPPRATTTTTTTPVSVPAPVVVPATAVAEPLVEARATASEPVAVDVADPVVDAVAATEELPVTCADEVVVAASATRTTTTETPVAALPDEPTTATPEPATTTPDDQATTAVVEAPNLRLVDAPVVVDEPVAANHAELVAGLVAAGRLSPDKAPAAVDAMPLVTADPRPSQRQIAEAAGIDRSIVKKLIDATEANQSA